MSPPVRPLTRQAVVGAAVRHVDEHGLGSLTMRRLGQDLGVEAMSLYHHVGGREDLLEAMVGHLLRQVNVPARVSGWQGLLHRVAHEVRAVAVAHPHLFPLVATRPPEAPWLRPPLRSIALVDAFLAALLDRGLTEDDVVHVYKVFTSFLLGHLLLEAAEADAPAAPGEEVLSGTAADTSPGTARAASGEHPTVHRLERRLRVHDAPALFEQALEALLDRLEGELASGAKHR